LRPPPGTRHIDDKIQVIFCGARYERAIDYRLRHRASGSDVADWLTNGTRDERFIDNIFAEMCNPAPAGRHSVKRASLHILIHHRNGSAPG